MPGRRVALSYGPYDACCELREDVVRFTPQLALFRSDSGEPVNRMLLH